MIPTFYFILILYQGEINSARLISSLPSPGISNEIVLKAVDATLAQDLLEPSYKAMIAYKLFDNGQVGAANKILTDLLEYDPRNLNFLEAKAIYAENSYDFNQVVAFRKRIAELNPYNALNLGRLAVAYIKVENVPEANKVLVRVNSFASGTEIAKELEREILNAQK
jgi:tetratricopeptide (TPR) repeat protein